MRWIALAVGLLYAGPAQAEEFAYRGQWEVRLPNSSYVAIVLIDGERRVTWDSPNDQGTPAIYRGYVAEATAEKMTIALTNKTNVTKTHCVIRSSELLHCHTIRADGSRSANALLIKTGPGPHRLTPPAR